MCCVRGCFVVALWDVRYRGLCVGNIKSYVASLFLNFLHFKLEIGFGLWSGINLWSTLLWYFHGHNILSWTVCCCGRISPFLFSNFSHLFFIGDTIMSKRFYFIVEWVGMVGGLGRAWGVIILWLRAFGVLQRIVNGLAAAMVDRFAGSFTPWIRELNVPRTKVRRIMREERLLCKWGSRVYDFMGNRYDPERENNVLGSDIR